MEGTLALLQLHLGLQFLDGQFLQRAAGQFIPDFLLLPGHIILDGPGGAVPPGPAAGWHLGGEDPVLGQLLQPPGAAANQLGDGGGAGPLRHLGQNRRRRGRCGFRLARHLHHLLSRGRFRIFPGLSPPCMGVKGPPGRRIRNETPEFFRIFCKNTSGLPRPAAACPVGRTREIKHRHTKSRRQGCFSPACGFHRYSIAQSFSGFLWPILLCF